MQDFSHQVWYSWNGHWRVLKESVIKKTHIWSLGPDHLQAFSECHSTHTKESNTRWAQKPVIARGPNNSTPVTNFFFLPFWGVK